ncbi:class I tRNA ligase family protein [bacterium]|nr:class I tRNA ligase family protein [bacterium]
MPKRHLITCALPYANGPVHIGHIAGCFLRLIRTYLMPSCIVLLHQ